ncbi:MAG: DUF2065 family protein [Gammaproteobacteria bacterium]|jgi:uncharacterized protein YjeT (DUF2065 family)|nr:DUF2065 family protein [Gammaproteobacteria bacterium]
MWREIGIAFSLMLVIEGIIPFLYPSRWRQLVATLADINNSTLRLMGLGSMIAGIILLYLFN